MPNPRLASRYAKSLLDLAIEKGQLDAAYTDMKYLQAVCAASAEFVNLLRSPIIKADQKNSIIAAVTKGKVSELTAAFNDLLVRKGRESDLPEIATAFVEQYNTLKGIHKVTLTTAVEVSADLQNAIAQKVKAAHSFTNVELESKVDPSLIGGFVLEFDNNLVDASVARDLRDIKKQFQQNLFVPQMK
jgi:F-type H+-transporting ATPase subunit delta